MTNSTLRDYWAPLDFGRSIRKNLSNGNAQKGIWMEKGNYHGAVSRLLVGMTAGKIGAMEGRHSDVVLGISCLVVNAKGENAV